MFLAISKRKRKKTSITRNFANVLIKYFQVSTSSLINFESYLFKENNNSFDLLGSSENAVEVQMEVFCTYFFSVNVIYLKC